MLTPSRGLINPPGRGALYHPGGLAPRLGCDVGVDAHGDRDVRVAEALLGYLGAQAHGEHQRRARVPEVVERALLHDPTSGVFRNAKAPGRGSYQPTHAIGTMGVLCARE